MRARALLIALLTVPWILATLACDEGITEPEEPELCPPGQVVDTLFTPDGTPYFLLCDPPMLPLGTHLDRHEGYTRSTLTAPDL